MYASIHSVFGEVPFTSAYDCPGINEVIMKDIGKIDNPNSVRLAYVKPGQEGD